MPLLLVWGCCLENHYPSHQPGEKAGMPLLHPVPSINNCPHSALFTHLTCVFSINLSTESGQELHLSWGSWCSANVGAWLSILLIFELIDERLQLASQRKNNGEDCDHIVRMGSPKPMVPVPCLLQRSTENVQEWQFCSFFLSLLPVKFACSLPIISEFQLPHLLNVGLPDKI